MGRWRANFRFTGCACSPSWYFEDWLVQVSNGVVEVDQFVDGRPDREIDERCTSTAVRHLSAVAGESEACGYVPEAM